MPPKKGNSKKDIIPTPQTTIAVEIGSKNIRAAQFDMKHNVPKILVFSNGDRYLEHIDSNTDQGNNHTSLSNDEWIKKRLNIVLEESNQYFQHDSESTQINKILEMDWFLGAWYSYMDPRNGVVATKHAPKHSYNFMAIRWGSTGIEIKCNRVINGMLRSKEPYTNMRPEKRYLKVDKVIHEKHQTFPTEYAVSFTEGKVGGNDIDELLMQFLATEFGKKYQVSIKNNKRAQDRLRNASEVAKKTLSNSASALIQVESLAEDIDFTTKVSQPRFEMLILPCINSVMDQLTTLYKTIEDEVDYVALVGGSANIPIFKKKIQAFFDYNQKENPPKILNSIPPEEVSVLGHSIHSIHSKSFIAPSEMTHTPSSIGVLHPSKGSFIIALERSVQFPTSTSITIEGDSEITSESLIIAEEEVIQLARFPIPQGTVYPFQVSFHLDARGCLSVDVFNEKLRFA